MNKLIKEIIEDKKKDESFEDIYNPHYLEELLEDDEVISQEALFLEGYAKDLEST